MSSLFSVGLNLQQSNKRTWRQMIGLFLAPKEQQSERYIAILHSRLHSFPLFGHVDGA